MNTSLSIHALVAHGLIVCCAASLPAQISPDLGIAQGASDDSVVGPLVLPFSFRMPDGSVVSQLFADSNGRVFSDALEPSDFDETLAELDSDPTQICVHWDDLNPLGGSGLGDVYFNDLGSSVRITWSDVVEFGAPAGTEFSVQLELFRDNSFVIRSDARVPASDAIVGCSVGNSSGLPVARDLSADAPLDSGVSGTVYEQFAVTAFDLPNQCLTFAPNGIGGYGVDFECPSVGQVVVGAAACEPEIGAARSVVFVRNMVGGYATMPNGGTPDMAFRSGTPLSFGDDSTNVVSLGFSMPMPGGAVVTDVEVDSNGRVFEVGAEASDFTESVAELLGDSTAMICPFWDDFDPSAGGQIWQSPGPGGSVALTWDEVPQFGESDTNSFQLLLFPSGTVACFYFRIDTGDGLVGLSAGNGASDPGLDDLSAGPVVTGAGSEIYELFDGSNPNDFGVPEPLPTLIHETQPAMGGPFVVRITQAPGSSFDFFLLGLPTSFALDPLGIPCSLLSDGAFGTFGLPAGTAFSLPVPFFPPIEGVTLRFQGAVLDPGISNPFSLLFTNPLDATLGRL